VARSISNINELEQLLPAIANVVSEQFGFYHTGIFMLDERAEFAVLEAANSEGGQRMLKRGHRLRVGATGIVGYVAGQGEARIALDVGSDAVFFNNPDLPNTRSEMALPLKAGADVIGVLDVQSTETNAFQTEDIKVLTTLANQVAVAIENSRLFGQTRKALAESQLVYDEYIRQEWSRFGHRLGKLGFVYDGIRTIPITTPDANQADATRIPIKIRGVTVGSIAIHSNDSSRQWTQDEIGLARAAAERAGLAIENLRLLDEAQRRASKERTIGDISSRLASSIDLNEIMATAVQELGRTLPDSEIILQFTNPEKS
jgi:GAF domain-containing protein